MATHIANDVTFNSGHKGVFFHSTPTEASVAQIVTNADETTQAAYIEWISIQADGTDVSPKLYDGSDGDAIFGLMCQSAGKDSIFADFKDDPLPTLCSDATQALCISAPALGTYSGFIKYYWGPKPH